MSKSPSDSPETAADFASLGLPNNLLAAIKKVGYESPSPIQAATIPTLLEGRDVLGQAQTGTGKTAAFVLPILAKIDLNKTEPQALILAPTRELAIQVAEACQTYASDMPGFHVLPIYGGQSYDIQLRQLRRGPQIIVGTPGRVMDHMRRNTLKLGKLSHLVLDEADEMLRMGFLEDVEWILESTPDDRQIALFSATMPGAIKRITERFLNNPVHVKIESKTKTADNIRQRYWLVGGMQKLDALTRILEAEPTDGMIIFTRTKRSTEELAERLEARGFAATALNGDIPQQQRERTVDKLRRGQLDILVATDVVARGLDVERISHVINFDIPTDNESYVHRIGRTGRAGRQGDAILFVTHRERYLLRSIERSTGQPIEAMEVPSVAAVNEVRIERFRQQIKETMVDTRASKHIEQFRGLLEKMLQEDGIDALDLAAALAHIAQGNQPLLLSKERAHAQRQDTGRERERVRDERRDRSERRNDRGAESRRKDSRGERPERPERKPRDKAASDVAMETFTLHVGHRDKVSPGNIVGAIANEAELDSKYIGRINIQEDHSTIDLPEGMPPELLTHLQKVWVSGRQLRITRAGETPPPADPAEGQRSQRPPRDDRGSRDGNQDRGGRGDRDSRPSRGGPSDRPRGRSEGGRDNRSSDSRPKFGKEQRKGHGDDAAASTEKPASSAAQILAKNKKKIAKRNERAQFNSKAKR